MVLPGQYLERPALVEAGEVTLEGLYHRGTRRPALLVCPAPGPGGGMDAPAIAELAWAAARAGHPSLRFQYRGVGASTGAPDPARAVEDAAAALAHLAATAGPRVALAAVGDGAAVALALASAHGIERVVLVAPLALPADPPPARLLVVLPEMGAPVALADARRLAGAAGRVDVVAGADLAWRAGLPAMGRSAIAWLAGP